MSDSSPSPEQIAKLPKWARDHIQRIERERDGAVCERKRTLDSQTSSPIYYGGFMDSGKKFIQTDEVTFTIGQQVYGEHQWPKEIRARIQNGRLRLMGAGVCGTLEIIPNCSNVIEIGILDR